MTAWRRPARADHDRWLVSYADLVTLLFAFFTTLYAASAVDATGGAPVAGSPGDAGSVDSAQAAEAAGGDALLTRLNATLEDDVRLQRADVARDARGVVVSLPEQATFTIGSAEVSAVARPLIAKVVNELSGGTYSLRIEGHTDDVPISTARFPSNWELSTARAGAVVAYLIGDLRFPPDRLSAAGYAEFHPRVPNTSLANRARNRRIDIVVIEGAGLDDERHAGEAQWSN